MTGDPFYRTEELLALGCTSVGRKVQVSRLARFYGFHGVIGDCTRIDDFCILKVESRSDRSYISARIA